MTAEYSVFHNSAVTDGSNFRIRNREERICTNSCRLPTTVTGIGTPYGVNADYSHQPYDASALNGAVPQCQGGHSCLARIGLHGCWEVFDPIIDQPVRNGSTQRQHQKLPAGADAKQ